MQLSPIQCTYSNIFIRFFKFFPANTNIYQNSYRVIGALCGLRQGVLSSECGYLISFGTKYLMSLQCGVHISFGTKYFVIARHRQRRCRGNLPEGYPLFVFPCRANFYCFLHNCQYDTLAKYMTDCDIFFGIILIIKLKTENASQKYNLIFWFITR